MFAKKEGEVLATQQAEVRGEKFLDGGVGVFGPTGARGEVLGPSVRRGEKKETPGTNQIGQDLSEKLLRIFDSIEKIGGENKVERTKVRKVQGIPNPKTDAFPDFLRRRRCPDRFGQMTLLF